MSEFPDRPLSPETALSSVPLPVSAFAAPPQIIIPRVSWTSGEHFQLLDNGLRNALAEVRPWNAPHGSTLSAWDAVAQSCVGFCAPYQFPTLKRASAMNRFKKICDDLRSKHPGLDPVKRSKTHTGNPEEYSEASIGELCAATDSWPSLVKEALEVDHQKTLARSEASRSREALEVAGAEIRCRINGGAPPQLLADDAISDTTEGTCTSLEEPLLCSSFNEQDLKGDQRLLASFVLVGHGPFDFDSQEAVSCEELKNLKDSWTRRTINLPLGNNFHDWSHRGWLVHFQQADLSSSHLNSLKTLAEVHENDDAVVDSCSYILAKLAAKMKPFHRAKRQRRSRSRSGSRSLSPNPESMEILKEALKVQASNAEMTGKAIQSGLEIMKAYVMKDSESGNAQGQDYLPKILQQNEKISSQNERIIEHLSDSSSALKQLTLLLGENLKRSGAS